MARVTVEDCIQQIPNRFDLVVTAAQRAKQISSGMPLTIDRDNDKDSVVSLREIADKTIDVKLVHEEIIQNFQKKGGFDPNDRIEGDDHGQNGTFSVNAQGEIEETFNEATQYIPQDQTGGMSFVEENIEVED
jgi:DNA-directed RNA polymerase subunit omega